MRLMDWDIRADFIMLVIGTWTGSEISVTDKNDVV